MNILFLTSANNSLCQRLFIELTSRRHRVAVEIASGDDAMIQAVDEHKPDLIVSPMLKIAIPKSIWTRYKCLIVHPGIIGDRGPSSLDWAILRGDATWGVTILEAVEEYDAGPIWASQSFFLDGTVPTKSGLYRTEVTEAAVRAVLQAVARFETGGFDPEPLDYARPDVRGRLRPQIRQGDRAIDWRSDTSETVVRKIRAADSQPGVLDTLFGQQYFLYGAHEEDVLLGAPGDIIAQRDGAICRGTIDGAVWISHLKARDHGPFSRIKLPAKLALGKALTAPQSMLPLSGPVTHRSYREIRYIENKNVGTIYFDFYNGAMSTDQCYRLRDVFLHARSRPTRVIVLMGGRDYFSNGIHLNVIEAAPDPAVESWRNINAIDDLIYEILTTVSHLVIAGMRGNSGAGGAMMALAADRVFAREGVVLNPHYKTMGGLFGSEYWTYTLPARIGAEKAIELTERCEPIGTREAMRIGFLDDAFGRTVDEFEEEVMERAVELARDGNFWRLRQKHQRLVGETSKPLASYRAEELQKMRTSFFGPDPSYHEARRRFVLKEAAPAADRVPLARRA